ncbi:MAG TPA: PKD domain-containing protein [Nevskiaceae bacterium]|nr:PKD domain-containing protein [Nevskiaceae bacterium]
MTTRLFPAARLPASILAFTALALFTGAAMAAKPAMPKVDLGSEMRGDGAVRALGKSLPGVAAHYGMSAEKFENILRKDKTSRLDRKGRLFYVESGDADEATTDGTPLGSSGAPHPLDQTFLLHSRPGAKRVIYLDFNGHNTSGTAWNSGAAISAQPYDMDGNPAAFSTAELERIQRVWVRVAEDYAPFDVDVTTQDPGDAAIHRTSSTDDTFGSRVVITPNTFYNCSCGGVAYVGTYDYYNSTNPGYYQPAWVFNASEVGISEAASHEAGHNVGLSHDGTASVGYYSGHGSGETSWGPLMGASYSVSVSQWSKGEYNGANNAEDDFAVIQQNGLAFIADDAGNTAASAAALGGTSANGIKTVKVAGLIGTRTDVDVYAFVSGGGPVSLTVSGSALKPNLDVLAELRNAGGTLVASANPTTTLSATISTTLAAGTYYLSVDGVGLGDPLSTGYTDYGSVGEYHIKGTYPDSGASAPVAAATATPTSGTAPLAVNFDGSGSSDADGTIAGWSWNFGDGNTGSGASPAHTYTTAGTFNAVLTVTDNQGLTSTASRTITVTAATQAISVRSVSVSAAAVKGGWQCTALVSIKNAAGANVAGATVNGNWSGRMTGTGSGITGSNGTATIKSGKSKRSGTCTYTVSGVTATGSTYDASANLQTSGSFTY